MDRKQRQRRLVSVEMLEKVEKEQCDVVGHIAGQLLMYCPEHLDYHRPSCKLAQCAVQPLAWCKRCGALEDPWALINPFDGDAFMDQELDIAIRPKWQKLNFSEQATEMDNT